MFGRLLLLFLIVPVVEVTLLITLGERMGFAATFAFVVGSALLGSWLARREGMAAWRRVQAKLAEGGLPGPELVDGLVVLISATLLIAPGFLTDAAGLLGLFPPTRALARRALLRRFERGLTSGTIRVATPGMPFGASPFGGSAFGPSPEPGIEDAEVVDDGRPQTGGPQTGGPRMRLR